MDVLPNQKNTWASLHGDVETLDEFYKRRSDLRPAGRSTELNLYIDDQLKKENDKLAGQNLGFHQVGSYSTSENNRLGELMYAKMALIHNNVELAEKLVLGHRLHPNLHDDYVAKTKCYG